MLVTTLLRQHHPVKFVYIFVGISLDRVTDSGVVMDSRMSFSMHIDITVEKALAMLGFMFQVSSGILILLFRIVDLTVRRLVGNKRFCLFKNSLIRLIYSSHRQEYILIEIYMKNKKCLFLYRILGHFMSHLCARSLSTQVVSDGLFMTCTSIEWSLCGEVCSSSKRRPTSFDPP
jgi:hypothetical protein